MVITVCSVCPDENVTMVRPLVSTWMQAFFVFFMTGMGTKDPGLLHGSTGSIAPWTHVIYLQRSQLTERDGDMFIVNATNSDPCGKLFQTFDHYQLPWRLL